MGMFMLRETNREVCATFDGPVADPSRSPVRPAA
ncbi:hypothetical protein SAMN05444722_3541 [Rhodovulum sp. ES.010]|nr:hypothetical protein SAMN05444722_3541 [Rhodovulum sp. ES.010]